MLVLCAGVFRCCWVCCQFIRWPGKSAIMGWLDKWQHRLLEAYRGGASSEPSAPVAAPSAPVVDGSCALPWANLTLGELIRVFTSETWDGQLDVSEFGRVLRRLLGIGSGSERVAAQLFACFDRDKSGLLDFREVFVGMAMLCSDSREDKLRTVFQIIDGNGSGWISAHELSLIHI